MPTYDYKCNACGHEFELFQSMSESAKRKCPECGRLALERLIGTGAAVLFKGGGFYETDYRSEGYKKAAEAEKKATSDSSTDSKSAPKPDAKPKSSEAAKSEPRKSETKPGAKPGSDASKPASK